MLLRFGPRKYVSFYILFCMLCFDVLLYCLEGHAIRGFEADIRAGICIMLYLGKNLSATEPGKDFKAFTPCGSTRPSLVYLSRDDVHC